MGALSRSLRSQVVSLHSTKLLTRVGVHHTLVSLYWEENKVALSAPPRSLASQPRLRSPARLRKSTHYKPPTPLNQRPLSPPLSLSLSLSLCPLRSCLGSRWSVKTKQVVGGVQDATFPCVISVLGPIGGELFPTISQQALFLVCLFVCLLVSSHNTRFVREQGLPFIPLIKCHEDGLVLFFFVFLYVFSRTYGKVKFGVASREFTHNSQARGARAGQNWCVRSRGCLDPWTDRPHERDPRRELGPR